MRVAVLGGGVIGVSAAYYLARDGHEVTVIDRQPRAACETSYANAGLLAPGHAYAWASPQAPGILWRSLFDRDQALRLVLRADPRMWSWGLRFLAQCTSERARRNTLRKLRLCVYSLECLAALEADTGIVYDGLSRGNLYLFRGAESLQRGIEHASILTEHGVRMEPLDREALMALEPALAGSRERIAGAIHAPGDRSGDARAFSRALAGWVEEHLRVRFLWNTAVRAIAVAGDRVERVLTDRGDLEFDLYVVALGVEAPFLTRRIGIPLPIYPCKGYSVTVPLGPAGASPTIGGVDEEKLVAFCPMGERLRITATAEFSGYSRDHRPEDFADMLRAVRELYPGGGDWSQPEYWAGLRPMTPSTVPILGFARYRNLLLDTGHGHIGWTMACGSGKVIADLAAGRRAEIDLEGLLYR